MLQPECICPLCGSAAKVPVAILPERGMVVANGKFAILTGHESQVLTRLAEAFPRTLSQTALLQWMYQFRSEDEEPDLKIIDVFVCKLRKKLKPLGVRIDTAWGRGYALAADTPLQIIQGEEAA